MPDLSRQDWENICPQLTIEAPTVHAPIELTPTTLDQIAGSFWGRGFLQLAPQFTAAELSRIVDGMTALKAAKIAPVYIYLFDQPWLLFEKLRPLLTHFLGDDYALLPNFWAWHLDAMGEAGWPVHRDCDAQTVFDVGGDKMAMSLSLWVPLTNVDEANGCMYVVEYGNEIGKDDEAAATPLPAAAGSVLGWPQDVLHFGGKYMAGAKNPRLSLSFEFQNTAFDPLGVPLLDTQKLQLSMGLEIILRKNIIKQTKQQNPDVYRLMSPLAHINADAPPFMLVHGDKDSLTSLGEAQYFASELDAVSPQTVDFAEVPGDQHAGESFSSLRSDYVMLGVAERLAQWHRDFKRKH